MEVKKCYAIYYSSVNLHSPRVRRGFIAGDAHLYSIPGWLAGDILSERAVASEWDKLLVHRRLGLG